MICRVCNQDFKGRRDAKTCSDGCRKILSRLSVTTSVTNQPVSVTSVTEDVTDNLSVTRPYVTTGTEFIKDCIHDKCPRTCPNYGIS